MDSADLQPDTGTVIVTVAALEAVTGMGKVTHLAIIDLDVGGVAWQLQGVRVVKQSGGLAVQPPQWRHPKSGVYIPAVVLPAELAKAIGDAILEALQRGPYSGL